MNELDLKDMNVQELSKEEAKNIEGGFLGLLLAGIIVGYQLMQMIFD